MREDDPNSGGLSRKTIEQELPANFDRLGMDTVDLYQIHRYDPDTPIEQTLTTLDDVVRRGQRYLGASSMWTHQFATALHTSRRIGLDHFVMMQNHYNLVYREEEREMLPYCKQENVGVIPWSPLAGGYLARPHEESDEMRERTHDWYDSPKQRDQRTRSGDCRRKGCHDEPDQSGVVATQRWGDRAIYGTSSVEHLEEAVEIDLSDSDVEYLEEPYDPIAVLGHE